MNRKFKPNRQGITLLFVISMIVLFLLMGTAFVVVSNTFNRESTNRIRSNVPEGKGSSQGNQIVDEVIYQLIRGTDLRNVDSPLRTTDMLADQYGYGIKSYVSTNTAPSYFGGTAFIQLALHSDPTSNAAPDNMGFNLRTLSTTAEELSPAKLNGTFGGRVLSFTSGPAKGFSARIVADSFDSFDSTTGAGTGVLAFRIPATSISGDTITSLTNLEGSEVIINGRDFSGSGADVVTDANDNPTGLGPQALLPNRVGESHATLLSYLNSSNSVNEPWDAADVATPFLSGFDKSGELLPSFHSQASFRAFDEGNDTQPDVDTDGDGVNDAYWMDLGMAVVTNAQGQRYRPLVAVHIRDLDGLLNVNAHSNRTHLQTDGYINQAHDWAGTGGVAGPQPNTPRGPGMGPPEINLTAALGGTAGLQNILDGRYGVDELPGDAGDPLNPDVPFRSRAKHFGHPLTEINPGGDIFGTIGGHYGSSAMDMHGRFRLGSPLTSVSFFDDFTDPNYADFMNGLPQIDMLTTQDIDAYTNEFDGNPYEMSLSSTAAGDTPFSLQELERLLRPNDIDSRILPDRLSSLISTNTGLFTTDSFDVPMLYRSFVEELDRNLQLRSPALTDAERTQLINVELNRELAFAPELYFGLKMDINRPIGDGIDNNGNGVVDEPGEEVAAINTGAAAILGNGAEIQMDLNYTGNATDNDTLNNNPRDIYARNLYMLAMLLLEPVDLDRDGTVNVTGDIETDERLQFAKAMAQWAANVVDFRDPDSIHTRFVYDPTPFDAAGWNAVEDASGNALPIDQIRFVWGCERPELLLTETLAVHLQNMEDNSGYEQRLRPEPFAYFEVYNPWTQNRLNQRFDPVLYNGGGVDLGLMAGDSPVWRFEVERIDADAASKTGFKPLRYVYMADPTDSAITYNDADDDQTASDIEVFFGLGGGTVQPGTQALIGTQGFEDPDNADFFQVFMGRKTAADDTTGNPDDILLDETTRLGLNADTGTVTRYTGNTLDSTRTTSIVFIDQSTTGSAPGPGNETPRKFSLSDKYEGYPDVDGSANAITEIADGDGSFYTTPYATSLDEVDGDRITANDIAMIRTQDGISKNFRYVRLQRLANPLLEWDPITNPYLTIDSMEVDLVSINGADASDNSLPASVGGQTQAVSHERGDATRTLWGHQRDGTIRASTGAASMDHHYAQAFTDSLGRTNDAFDPTNNALKPFAWLTWNNRPFVSHMEIMNVPYLAPDRLTYAPEGSNSAKFTIDDKTTITDPFTENRPETLAGRYGHLLNYFGSDDDTAGTDNFSDTYKLLDFLEVPSRFVGNESWYLENGTTGALQHPFNTISHYRVPGKININTIPPDAIDATTSMVWDTLAAEYSSSALDWGTFKDSLYGSLTTLPTDFANPFRPAEAANLVPGVTTTTPGSACTLLRPRIPGVAKPLFDYDSGNASDDTDRSAAFRNGFRTRLGNMVTTKSSVFAGWITVGYFEVDENDDLELTNNEGIEIGADSGEQTRNRAFFIFDRSIPVAYEPGKNHNIDKAIRVKTIIQ